MENRIRNLGTLLVGSWVLPVTQAAASSQSSDSTVTVVLLVLLLLALWVVLILAWKRLIRTEGGEGYHPRELWGRAQEMVQNAKTRWSPEEQDEDSTAQEEESAGQDEEHGAGAKDEEADITAL